MKKSIINSKKADEMSGKKKEELKERAQISGCEMTDGQLAFMIIEFEKEWALNTYLRDRSLEFVNERTRVSVIADFERLIFDPENKDADFSELLDSLLKDENGEYIWDLFSPDSTKKHRLTVYGESGELKYVDISKILPPCGNTDATDETNPFEKNSWNMAAQSKIYKENPELAKYLAFAANK